MATNSVDLGWWPGIAYGIGLTAFIALAAWHDAKAQRKARREAELMRQHLTFLHGEGQGRR